MTLNSQNKKLINILIILFIGLVVLGLIIFFKSNNLQNISRPDNTKNFFPLDYLSVVEKEKFGLPATAKVQALKRNESGQVLVYKIIRSDQDIVLDPSKISPLSPHQRSSAN